MHLNRDRRRSVRPMPDTSSSGSDVHRRPERAERIEVEPGDVVLRDGGTLRIRMARPDDVGRIEDYLIGLSLESRRLRFGNETIDVTRVAAAAADSDPPAHLTLLTLQGGDRGTVVGGGQIYRMQREADRESPGPSPIPDTSG